MSVSQGGRPPGPVLYRLSTSRYTAVPPTTKVASGSPLNDFESAAVRIQARPTSAAPLIEVTVKERSPNGTAFVWKLLCGDHLSRLQVPAAQPAGRLSFTTRAEMGADEVPVPVSVALTGPALVTT